MAVQASMQLPLLQAARIASPCSMRWEDMSFVGDGERERHCSACDLNVHNFEGLASDEAEALLAKILDGERVCGRVYQRADGTILTRDCPVGVSAARARLASAVTRVAAVLALLLTGRYLTARVLEKEGDRGGFAARLLSPFHYIAEKLDPTPQVIMMGAIAIPPTPLPPPPPPAAPPAGPTLPTPPEAFDGYY